MTIESTISSGTVRMPFRRSLLNAIRAHCDCELPDLLLERRNRHATLNSLSSTSIATKEEMDARLDKLTGELEQMEVRVEALEAVVAIHPIAFAISLMHCKNVELRPVEPVEGLSRAHMKRRGRPLVRYHELHIEPMKAVLKTEGGLGEGAGLSKAMHIARGHFKDFRNGKGLFGRYKGTFWWPQHLRGSAEQGTVLKDYKVSAPDDVR